MHFITKFFTKEKEFEIMKKHGIRNIIVIVTTISLLFILSSCSNKLTQEQLQEILNENRYTALDIDSIKMESVIDLGDDITGLPNNKYNQLVLVSGICENSIKYDFFALNSKEEEITEFTFLYKPLEVIMNKIFEEDSNTNINNLKKSANYIKNYGTECFTDVGYSQAYIREITGPNGIIPTKDAQNAIIESLEYIYDDMDDAEDSIVIFETHNANPMYYAKQVSAMVYTWSWPSEANYASWKSAQTYQKLMEFERLYGPAYDFKTVWKAVDTNLDDAGTFNSKDEVMQILANGSAVGVENPINTTVSNTAPIGGPQTPAPQEEDQNTSSHQPLYLVRKSANDASSQLGAFHEFSNATKLADKNKASGYEVYDEYGNLVYAPATSNSNVLYRVRKSAGDAASQIGAFNDIDNAIKLANQNKSQGYEVYDSNGNLVYTP